MTDSNDNDKRRAERWLAAELDRLCRVAERALRALQNAQIRPQPGHPTMAEIEGVLAARRSARLGPSAKPEIIRGPGGGRNGVDVALKLDVAGDPTFAFTDA